MLGSNLPEMPLSDNDEERTCSHGGHDGHGGLEDSKSEVRIQKSESQTPVWFQERCTVNRRLKSKFKSWDLFLRTGRRNCESIAVNSETSNHA